MGQVNLYVPDDLEEMIKREAKRQGKSVSAFVLEAVKTRVSPDEWSPELTDMLRASEGDIPDIDDLPLQKRGDFDEK